MIRILCDIDNVLANTDFVIKEKVCDITGEEPYTSWHSDQNTELMNEVIAIVKYQPNFWRNIPGLTSGFTLLKFLSKHRNLSIEFVSGIPTKTGIDILNQKNDWVRRNCSQFSNILHLSNDRSRIYADVLIDDGVDFIKAWKKNHPKGLVIMPRYDHNRELWEERHEWLKTYHWRDVDIVHRHAIAKWIQNSINAR